MFFKLFFSLLLIISFAQAENGLIAHWTFDSFNADTFYNSAQNDYHVSSPGLKTAKGVVGNALFLSETSFKPVIQNSANAFLLSQFTVEAWVQIYEDPAVMGRLADQYKILEFTSIGSYTGFSFCIHGGGRPDITLGQSSWVECTSPEAMKLKRWYHLVGTCDGQMLRIYMNGRKVNQLHYSGTTVPPRANATIGCQVRNSGEPFCHFFGLIDELKLYNYPLDSSAIVTNYIASNPYPEEPRLLAHWSFDSFNADTFYNSARNDFHVSSPGLKTAKGVVGNALFLSDTSFKQPIIKNSANAFLLSQFSIETWVQIYEDPKVMDREYYQYKILEYSSIDPSLVADGFSLCIKEGSRPNISLGQETWVECTSPQSLQKNRWYHLTGTCDGQFLRLYINGKMVQKLAYSGTMVAPEANATIGCQVRETSAVICRYFGLIDELKLYNYPLDSSTIAANYIASNPYPDQPRLLAHWSFDSLLYPTFYDLTKNGFNAIVTKGSTSTSDGLKLNSLNCMQDSFLVVVKNSSTAFNVPQFTIEGWIYSYIDLYNPGSHFNARSIFTTQTWTMSGTTEGIELAVNPEAKLQLVMAYPDRNDWNYCISDSILRPRKWYHVAASYDGATMRLFVNGKIAGSKTYSDGYRTSHSDAVIGCQMPADSSQWRNWFKGKMDELKFYNYAIDQQTITSIYNELKPVDDPPFEINFGMKTTYAQSGDTVVMPIYITNFEDFNINACQFSIKFDSSKLDLLSMVKDSGIISSWPLFTWNPITRDSISVAMAGTSTPISYGEGEFVRCIFRVKSSALDRDTCTISINNISIDEAYQLISATVKNGKIIVAYNPILYGDVTGNNEVNIFDAQKVLSYVVGSLILPDSVCCPNFTVAVADVSGNGSITSYDAALIFQHSVGLLPEFPVVQPGQKRLLQKSTVMTSSVAHLTAQIENVVNNELRCTIIGSNLKGFVAGEFSIGFDPSIVTPSRGSITTSVRGATLNSKIDEPNKLLKVAIVTNNDIDESEPVQLLSITLPPTQGNAIGAFFIKSALLNEGKILATIMSTTTRPDHNKSISTMNKRPNLIIRGNELVFSSPDYKNVSEICIWTMNGKTILNKHINSHSTRTILPLKLLAPGSYLYKVKCGSVMNKGKFIISH